MHRRTAIGIAAVLGCAPAFGSPLAREGEGERRAALDAMEGAPAPEGLLDHLDAWTVTRPLTEFDLRAGDVTIFVTMDVSNPASMRIGSDLEKAAGYDDVQIFAVHPANGWERFELLVKAGTIPIPGARDAGGFAEALLADETPDVYMIDRAGNLRFADLSEGALADAAMLLSAETPERAAAAVTVTGEGAGASGEARQATADADLPALDELNSFMISPALYEEARWPRHNAEPGAADFQGRKLPALGNETWISEKDRDPADHVLVLDFWATWCGPCIAAMPKLEGLQRSHNEDLMVLAIGGQSEDERTVRRWVEEHGEHYYHLFDSEQTIISQLRPQGIPHVVIVSTDGVVRWQGNPHNRAFAAAARQVAKVDPLIRLKRGRMDLTPDVLVSESERSQIDYGWPAHNDPARISAKKNMQGEVLTNPLQRTRFIDGMDRPDVSEQVLVLDFWATWCPPCKRASPILSDLAEKFEDDAVIVAVSGQSEDQQTVERYIARHKVNYRHAFAPDQRTYNRLGVQGIPHVVVMSSDGVVRWQGNPLDPRLEGIIQQTIDADTLRRSSAMATP